MGKRRVFTAALILLTCAPLCLAQKDDGKQQPPPRTTSEGEDGRRREQQKTPEGQKAEQNRPGGLVAAELPKGDGAWVVQIVTGGGIMGVGRGNLTVTSDGGVTCAPAAKCLQTLTPESVRTLAEAVAAAKTKSWAGKPTDVCHDCYFTTMMLQRREPEHGARTYLFSWDDIAAGKMPDDVRRVYETALAVAAARQ